MRDRAPRNGNHATRHSNTQRPVETRTLSESSCREVAIVRVPRYHSPAPRQSTPPRAARTQAPRVCQTAAPRAPPSVRVEDTGENARRRTKKYENSTGENSKNERGRMEETVRQPELVRSAAAVALIVHAGAQARRVRRAEHLCSQRHQVRIGQALDSGSGKRLHRHAVSAMGPGPRSGPS